MRLTTAFPRHVAASIIGEGREPANEETRHLATCPACFAAVRRGRAFDRQLGEAVAALPSPPLPPEVLTVPMPSIRRPSSPSLTSLGVIAALVVAAGLVGWTVLPRGEAGSSAQPTLSPDPHVVVADGATWRIELVGRTLEVHRRRDDAPAGTDEQLLAQWDLGDFVNGGAITTLRCPHPNGVDVWAVLGHHSESIELTFHGPPARGADAPDGVFLWVLDAPADPGARITLTGPDGRVRMGLGALEPRSTDVHQSSGCFLQI